MIENSTLKARLATFLCSKYFYSEMNHAENDSILEMNRTKLVWQCSIIIGSNKQNHHNHV